jgi:hypothetical protein
MADLVDILEVAYSRHDGVERWLTRLGEALDGVGPALRGFPLAVAYTYQVIPEAPVRVEHW